MDKENSNSAIICQVKTSDYGSGVLDGIDFLRNIERKAFIMGGKNYCAPVQNVVDFIKDRNSTKLGEVKPTYAIGTQWCKVDEVLPNFITSSLRVAFADFERKIKGFSTSGILTCAETRTSSPVRIVRGEKLNAIGISNAYPSGEVGYTGGIMSSALDGLKIATAIKEKYKN